MEDWKLLEILELVVDNYIEKWEPIWSKFLHTNSDIDYAPSTLRKYLNILEKSWLLFQPYNSSGRIPTLKWFSLYVKKYLNIKVYDEQNIFNENLDLDKARKSVKYIVETLWYLSDWVVVWFVRNDEYYYLWINNLLEKNIEDNFETTKEIINFIEKKQLIKTIDTKIIKSNQIYYTFVKNRKVDISCLYCKINLEDYDCIISIVWSIRIDYKKNIILLNKLLKTIDV